MVHQPFPVSGGDFATVRPPSHLRTSNYRLWKQVSYLDPSTLPEFYDLNANHQALDSLYHQVPTHPNETYMRALQAPALMNFALDEGWQDWQGGSDGTS